MAFYKQDIVDINLNTGNIFRSFLNHSIGFKDDDADRFGIRAFRDGEPVDLTGASCQAVFMAPNGVNIALTSYGTVSGNVAYVTLPQACYDVEGQFCLAIKLISNGVTSTVRIVDGVVERTGASGAVAPTGSVPTYQEVLAAYDAAIAAVDDVNVLKSAMTHQQETMMRLNGDTKYIPWEFGLRYVNNGSEAFGNSNANIAVKRGQYIKLKKGDTIKLSDETTYQFYGGYTTDLSSFVSISWRTARYVVTIEGYYFFSFRKANQSTLTNDDVKNANNTLIISVENSIETIQSENDGEQASIDSLFSDFYSFENVSAYGEWDGYIIDPVTHRGIADPTMKMIAFPVQYGEIYKIECDGFWQFNNGSSTSSLLAGGTYGRGTWYMKAPESPVKAYYAILTTPISGGIAVCTHVKSKIFSNENSAW